MSKEKEIRVLYLDDEPANLNAFRASFRREFDIRITSNGEEALELLGSFKPQIVFSDQRMPGMNGTEFLAKVHELRPHTIRILITAYTDADEIIKAVNIGRIYRFISKPWIEEDLRQTILNGYDIYTTRQSLVEKVEELQKTNEELNKFIYSASHDLRAPLMSILGVVKLSELDPMDESARNLFQMIESSVVRMDTFISSIIEYYQNSRSVQDLQEIDFAELVDEVRENLKFFEGANEMQFDIQIDPCPDFVTDLFRLRIVLSNLMSNAMKYQRLDVPEHRVGIQVLCKDDSVELVVEDNGTGIAEDQQALVFNMFHRADAKKSGSGIGLYIVKEALEKLSGSIELRSVPDQGTTFTCSIPNLKK